ncbi:MFS transporter [Sinorhizobium medicae]|uniref:MFS transporter n=2 Tax=Sinorhizobium medicae TaxID=110321 RepID=A0A6G1WKZ6_9HYPH|nr:MFS transporter [Sinorhizobium medicae]MDX0421883.1 MFS transporter [Sinorhizobium medicae]MDX0519450.1 MFS transporter [Sinorhizobium medicae]MDX0544249.1 MFS transporter [Sinorhizobium medicae]MDX0632142.1 MFS transporter [Sinorhizobium medicae]MDX0711683.1 MFS transporter [Sinorhizobium medicae]
MFMSKPAIAAPDEASGSGGAAAAQWALASLSLSVLLSSLGTSIANVGLPSLAAAFSASFQQVQWVVLAYLLAISTLIVTVGRLGDIIGRRRLLLAGILLFTLSSALSGAASNLPVLIFARSVQGLGAAVMMTLAMALVGDAVAKERTGSAMGLLGTMSAVGTALGPSLGGVLIAGLGWRAIFLVNVPLGALAFLLAWRSLPADRQAPEAERPGFDVRGTLLLGFTLAAYALAMTVSRGSLGPLNLSLLAAAILGAGLFVLVERRAASPLIRLQTLRNPVLAAGLAMSTLVSTVMMATLVVGPFYLSRSLGLGATMVGIVMAAGPVVSALSGLPAGRAVDRLGAPFMILAGLVAMAAGSFALSVLPEMFGVAGYLAAMLVLTPGYQLFQAANNTAVMRDVRPDRRGVVSGMLNLSRNLGLVTGASAMGAIFAFATAEDVAAANAGTVSAGMQVTFAVAGVLVIGALLIALRSRALARSAERVAMPGRDRT